MSIFTHPLEIIFKFITLKTRVFFILFILLLLRDDAASQRLSIRAGLGTSSYFGDLVQGFPILSQTSPSFNLGGVYDITEQFKARVQFSYLRVRADDKNNKREDYRDRNLNFKSNVFETAVLGEYDFLNKEEYFIVPYVFGGIGLFTYNPTTTDLNGNKVNLRDARTEGQGFPAFPDRKPYSKVGLNISAGLGIRMEYSDEVAFSLEYNYRQLFTDYLDDVSKSYPDPNIMPADWVASSFLLSYRGHELGNTFPGSSRPRGSSRMKDAYYTIQFTATFRLHGLQIGKDLSFYGSGTRNRVKMRNPKRVY